MENHERLNMIHTPINKIDKNELIIVNPIMSKDDLEQVEHYIKCLLPVGFVSQAGKNSMARNSLIYVLNGTWQSIMNILMLKGINTVVSRHCHSEEINELDSVCIKVQTYFLSSHKDVQSPNSRLESCINEDNCHKIVSENIQICPEFYCGVSLPVPVKGSTNHDYRLWVRLSFMRYIKNAQLLSCYMDPCGKFAIKTLEGNVDSHIEFLSKLYAIIEMKVVQMWKSGIVHCDMHEHNLVVIDNPPDVFILDFGHAIQLPEELRQSLVTSLDSRSNEDVFSLFESNSKVRHFIFENHAKRGFDYMYLDSKLLSMIKSHIRLLKIRSGRKSKTNSRSKCITKTPVNVEWKDIDACSVK